MPGRWGYEVATYRKCAECPVRFPAIQERAHLCSARCRQRARRRRLKEGAQDVNAT